jgi:methionyl-tRNA formyltransferase
MKIVFIGTVDFSYHCLNEVIKNNGEVCGIITYPESPINSDYKDITPLAAEHNIPVYHTVNINDPACIQWAREKKPDIIFCFGISQIIKTEMLHLAPMGILGIHPALLPKNRGRHPLIWALALGLKESGLTFFFMDKGVDSGPILSQKTFSIEYHDDAYSLYQKIKALATIQIADFMPILATGNYQLIPQDHSKANYWRKRTCKDGMIDWRMSAENIRNTVRALVKPYPGAEFIYKNSSFTLWKVENYSGIIPKNIEPGKVISIINNNPLVRCGDGAVILTDYEPAINFKEGDYLL